MKDQYFGDFGDYQKVSLLRRLAKKLPVVTHWMKTRDDSSTDGQRIGYLEQPEVWRRYDPEVFDFIQEKLASEKRSLSHIERSPLCDRIVFINDYIEDSEARERSVQSLCNSKEHALVFLDPDNGIEVTSTSKRNVHKYVTWRELQQVFDAGKSVLVYQHFPRVTREEYIQRRCADIASRTGCHPSALHVKHSVYFLLGRPEHTETLDAVLSDYVRTWGSLARLSRFRDSERF